MAEPDELYTLRAQFWLGHYGLAMEEAKSVIRRPMSPALKIEREELSLRCQLGLGQNDKVIATAQSSAFPGIRALGLRAQFDSTDDAGKQSLLPQLQTMLGEGVTPSVQLTAAHVFLASGMKKEALQCVHEGMTMEHKCLALQIYLQIDRIDLAQQELTKMKRADEDSILSQLGGVYIALAKGSSVAKDAVHTLTQLSEQYGPSTFLLNLMACAYMCGEMYESASQQLEQIRTDFIVDADTLANMIVCSQHLGNPVGPLIQQLKTQYPSHFMVKGLEMVEGAFERESIKYKVAA
mmetsp:Transcript_6812/g.19938  ORF Transcript_6812/g.19938 Transcript_6812/m.19938 type:complete len:294 (-) Transcript_6812:239-1120(-)